ncbi:MAG: lipopolysaccharide biosynthesis protein, partial [Spirochaetales bacterium]|nr:lipopolysaccharide biosynthesis protein [Spirochaetales bacterium]
MAREEFEIDLVDLIKFCWKKVWYFVIPMAVAAVLLVAFCVISIKMDPEKSPLPNKYTSTAKILVRETSAKSSISSSLSSLASMAGVNIGSASGGTSNGVLITTLAETNTFRDDIIEKFDLISKYKIKKNVKTSSRKALSKALTVKLDDKTGVLSVSFTDIDPEFAHEVASYATDLLIEQFYQVSEDDDAINLKNYQEAMDQSFLKIVQYQKDIQELEQSVSNAYATSVPSIMFDVTMKKME